MSSTRKESTQTGTHFDSIFKYTPNKSDILKQDTSVHISISTVRNKQVKPGSKSFKMIQSFQGSHASTLMAAHKTSCNMQLQSRNIDLLSISRNWQPILKSFEDSKAMGEYMLPMFLTFGHLISSFISLVSNCVCVFLTTSSEGLPSDPIPIAGRTHPPQRLQRHTPVRHPISLPLGRC